MEWTYATYTIANYGISFGLVLFAIIGVFATFLSSKKGQEFVTERVIGVSPTKAHDDYDDHDARQHTANDLSSDGNGHHSESKQYSLHMKQRSIKYIGIFCCLLGGLTLSITGVLMFQGCFLTSTRLLPGDDCPENSMDCFIFKQSDLVPITNNVSFLCEPLEKAQFPNNVSDGTAWCFGWIIRLQTTKSVLDQLGVAIALIGFFTTMLAVIVYLGKSNKTIILSVVFISTCTGVIIVLLVFKWSFAPLTYAILSLGIGLGVFGLVLFCILPKPETKVGNEQILTASKNQERIITNSTLSYPKRPKPNGNIIIPW
jgi:hypothetical protein